MIPKVVASEIGAAQTLQVLFCEPALLEQGKSDRSHVVL